MAKIDVDIVLISTTAAVAEIVDLMKYDDFAIGVKYGAGAGGNMKLQASVDGVNFSDVTGTTIALDVLGGSHIYNVDNAHFRWLKIIVPASAATVVQFTGEENQD